jgi:hypothetical protein
MTPSRGVIGAHTPWLLLDKLRITFAKSKVRKTERGFSHAKRLLP